MVWARDIESTIMPVPSCRTLIARPSGGKVRPSSAEAFLPSVISAAHVSPTDCRTMIAVSAWETSRTVLAMSSRASSSSAPSSIVVVRDCEALIHRAVRFESAYMCAFSTAMPAAGAKASTTAASSCV